MNGITALLLWLSGPVALPRWLVLIGTVAVFVWLCVLLFIVYFVIEGKLTERRLDEANKPTINPWEEES